MMGAGMNVGVLILCVFLLVGGGSLFGVLTGIITLPWHATTAQVDSAHKIVDKTYDAENAIYNYEWFKTQYQDIQAAEKNIQNTKEQMDSFTELNGNNTKDWDYQTKESYRQLQTTYNGQRSYYNGLVADYNAKSEMANRNIFKDKLPMHVDQVLY